MTSGLKFSAISILLLIMLGTMMSSSYSAPVPAATAQSDQHKKQVTLNAILVEPKPRWDILLKTAMQKLQERHPDMNIKINYTVLPYDIGRVKMLNSLGNKSSIDLVSVDQIWLGDFAERGYLTDLTSRAQSWGRLPEWYQSNLAGSLYKGKTYGIWAWTDVTGIWYWKDLLNKAGVDPNSLTTWDGYLATAKKLNNTLKSQNIQGIGIDCGGALWYPYLWMLGGEIIKMKDGHPTKGTYWFPAFNSSAGVKAMQFIKNQINAGIKPIANGNDDEISLVNRTYAVFPEGSWMPEQFPPDLRLNLTKNVGFIPMYPVPKKGMQTTTVMGGWELSIPQSSKNKDLVWELITLMLEPDVLTPMLIETGYLPTQKSIGQGPSLSVLNQTVPYYDRMLTMIPLGRSRPNIPEFPQIDDHVTQAIKQVCSGVKEPKQALDGAAAKSAKLLGW